jgi:hypothetical protein
MKQIYFRGVYIESRVRQEIFVAQMKQPSPSGI